MVRGYIAIRNFNRHSRQIRKVDGWTGICATSISRVIPGGVGRAPKISNARYYYHHRRDLCLLTPVLVEVRRKLEYLVCGRPSLDHPALRLNTLRGGAGLGKASCSVGATLGLGSYIAKSLRESFRINFSATHGFSCLSYCHV
ncbi:hypothetical protein PUN28_002858 [Cardiocondyla obscurior]|uniref:Uncharacterized protein n=1 Tax=Cardiocondyla obscurior TaxID=286306 RepID=A0AAW2GWD1_9HYME